MSGEITARSLADQKRGLFWWSVGIAGIIALVVLSWPSVKDIGDIDSISENFSEGAKEIFGLSQPLSSPIGYLDSQLFAYFFPVLLLVYGIGKGAKTIAGEEEDGRLEVMSSLPISRSRIVIEKAVACCLGVLVLAAVALITLQVGCPLVNLDIGFVELSAATLGSTLVGIDGALAALTIGCLWGRAGIAIAIPASYIAATYIAGSLAVTVDFLKPIQGLSPLYWAQRSEPLQNGFQVVNIAVLVGAGIALTALAVFFFRKRDLRLG